jgi:spore maturation protein CgeB
MKFVVFGLTVSSSWGNGHATLWRGLCRALAARGHEVVFFEKDVPYYAAQRDLHELPGGRLVLYAEWSDVAPMARQEATAADVALVTSYCPDGPAACDLVLSARAACRVFYDLDTPVTLDRLRAGERVFYLPASLEPFDLVLSFTGGAALDALRERLGARRVAPLYGSVDPGVHAPVSSVDCFRADLSYLGTYAEDRQAGVDALLVEPARRRPALRFVIGGAQYPHTFPWTDNIYFVRHLPPADHPAFYSSSRLTLNVTRRAMAAMGYCPSGRLFEAAACGAPILSDDWEGLDHFYDPATEILVARDTDDVVDALALPEGELRRRARAARERTLAEHTAEQRVRDLERALEAARAGPAPGGA